MARVPGSLPAYPSGRDCGRACECRRCRLRHRAERQCSRWLRRLATACMLTCARGARRRGPERIRAGGACWRQCSGGSLSLVVDRRHRCCCQHHAQLHAQHHAHAQHHGQQCRSHRGTSFAAGRARPHRQPAEVTPAQRRRGQPALLPRWALGRAHRRQRRGHPHPACQPPPGDFEHLRPPCRSRRRLNGGSTRDHRRPSGRPRHLPLALHIA